VSPELKRFADVVYQEVQDGLLEFPEVPEPVRRNASLGAVFVSRLEEVGVLTDTELCPHEDMEGRGRCAITAASLSDDGRAVLLAAHYTGSTSESIFTVSRETLGTLSGRAARFVARALSGDLRSLTESPEALDVARRLGARRSMLQTIRVLIATDGRASCRDIQDIDIDGLLVTFDVIDLERLHRISQEATSREDIVVDLTELLGRPLPCLEMKPRPAEYETYLAIFPGTLLFSLYERYGQRLFEFNVRSFLQAKGRVNKGIRDTLRSTPERFMAYNNGIVATADEIEAGILHGELVIRRITGLQIVNGAQTTASIHRAHKLEKIDISGVSVATKITRVDPSRLREFVPLISKYANTQNAVQVADLSANNDFHIALERLSEVTWCPGESSRWFYERARGSYEVALLSAGTSPAAKRVFREQCPVSQRLSKTDLARYWLASACRPYVVSLGAQKAFSTFMNELPEVFPEGWSPDPTFFKELIGRAIIYRATERIVRAEKFPAYRANIAAYTVATLFHVSQGEVDLMMIWNNQSISDELKQLLTVWAREVDSAIRKTAGSRNVTEWCKKPQCWEEVSRQLSPPSHPLPPELHRLADTASGEPTQIELSEADQERVKSDIERCLAVDAAGWARIHHWGLATKRLNYVQRGVAHTLGEYAAAGWLRLPSAKQARHGARAIELAIEAGILD